jgi:hypothetical protein
MTVAEPEQGRSRSARVRKSECTPSSSLLISLHSDDFTFEADPALFAARRQLPWILCDLNISSSLPRRSQLPASFATYRDSTDKSINEYIWLVMARASCLQRDCLSVAPVVLTSKKSPERVMDIWSEPKLQRRRREGLAGTLLAVFAGK